MAITEEQYKAAVELQRRGSLSPQQSAAAAEIINRYSLSITEGSRAEQRVRETAAFGPESRIEALPPETTGIGKVAGAIAGSVSTEMPGARLGQTLGSVVGTALTRTPAGARAGGNLGAFAGAVIGSAVGAGVGGGAGELAEQMGQGLYRGDGSMTTAFNAAVAAGEEEAAYDLIGGLIFRGGTGVIRKAIGGPTTPGAEEAQGIMRQYGTNLALDQVVDRAILDEISGALRGSLFSGTAFDELNKAQDKAVVQFYNDFISQYARTAGERLTKEGAGRLLLTSLRGGESVFDKAASDMFSLLDRQVVLRSSRPTEVFEQTAPAMAGVRDKPAGRMVPAQAFEAPVDVSAVRSRASQLVDAIKDIGDVDPKAEGTTLLRNIASGAKRLNFSQTHTLISDLKRLQRSGRLQGLPAEKKLGDFIGMLQDSFDAAGKNLPQDLSQAYAKMRSFTRFGKQRFESEFVAKLLENDAVDGKAVVDIVTNASQGDIVRLRQTLRLADRFRNVEAGSSWRNVQATFLDEIMPRNVAQIKDAKVFNLDSNSSRDLAAQLEKVFSKEERAVIDRNVNLIKDIVLKRPGTGALSGRQAGAALRGVYMLGAGAVGLGAYQEGGMGGASGIAAYLFAPKVLAHAIASPKLTRALAAWDNAFRVTGPSRGNATVKAVRLFEEIYEEATAETQQ